MRSKSTMQRWVRELRRLIDSREDAATTRIAYAMETAIRVALSKPGEFRDYNPVKDARTMADYLHAELSSGR